MDIIIDNPSLKYDLDEAHGLKKSAQVRRKQLTAMLAKPIFPTGLISGKYPLSSNNSEMLEKLQANSTESAIGVMKNAIEAKNNMRKRPRNLFKSRINTDNTVEINNKELLAPPKKQRKIKAK